MPFGVPPVVIVGAGHAGAAVAARLRAEGLESEILVVGEEGVPPYQRPPLSKDWLGGKLPDNQLPLRPAEFWSRSRIQLMLGRRATDIDRPNRALVLDSGEHLRYAYLVLATGSRPRDLVAPGAETHCVMTLRSLGDARRLRTLIGEGKRLAVIGAGYLGLEVAATAAALGMLVTVVEREACVLPRVASSAVSQIFEREHTERGTTFRLGDEVVQIRKDVIGTGCSLVFKDGTSLNSDGVLVAIGASPAIELAAAAGLSCGAGATVDENGRTSDPHIFAIGDMALRPVFRQNLPRILESIPSATELAARSARAIVGAVQQPELQVPWFWSDQFGLRLQTCGMLIGDAETVTRRTHDGTGVAVYHLSGDELIAVETINAPRAFVRGRQVIEARSPIDRSSLDELSS